MKIQVIPDVHGGQNWKHLVKPDIFDKIVFLGDYMDSFTKTWKECYENLEDILIFKNMYPDKVILLAGNHDNQYIYYHTEIFRECKCSGFSASAAWKTNKLFWTNLRSFQAAYQVGNVLFSHAGLVDSVFKKDIRPLWDYVQPLDEFLTMLWRQRNVRVFKIGVARGGDCQYGGIFWADKCELIEDPLKDFTQVVGHTPVNRITIERRSSEKLVFTDCIEHGHEELYTLIT